MSNFPPNLPARYRGRWREPWRFIARHSPGFRRWCWRHGYLSPHFRRSEGASHGGDACGCSAASIPDGLKRGAQRHAFDLEQVRHRLGRSLAPLGWYRTPCHNGCVGGATSSQHLLAKATDWAAQPDQARFDAVMRDVFAGGGIGSCASGRVAHVDSRNGAARWTYANC